MFIKLTKLFNAVLTLKIAWTHLKMQKLHSPNDCGVSAVLEKAEALQDI